MRAALKGSEQIGFTIMSLTVSLIAVLIPLLFMSDVVGRLFREFAITLAVTILVSAVVSLTLTPMMCSRILKDKATCQADALLPLVGEGLQLDHRFLRPRAEEGPRAPLHHAAGHDFNICGHGSAVHRDSQGLFPGAGYGRDSGHQRSAADGQLCQHGRAPAEARRRRAAGSGRRQRLLVHRRGRNQHDAELGPHPDHAEAARRAQDFCDGRDSPPAGQGGRR